MTFIICFLLVFILSYGAIKVTPKVIVHLASKAPVKAVERTKEEVKARAEQFSYIGWQVIKAFESLPDANRPSFDIESVIKTLDFKYGIHVVNDHFPYSTVRNINGRVLCDCIVPRYDYRSGTTNSGKRHSSCQKFKDYVVLVTEAKGIERDLRDQKRALEKQERAIQLAGKQNELDSAQTIADALRAERDIIKETTTEIYKQTASIK